MRSPRTLHAPAKINLTLEVLRKRPDGYHGIRSVMVPVGLYDELLIEPSRDGPQLRCDRPELEGDDNLVLRAFRALDPPERRWCLTLRKRIPIQAGLGGGSSDAAAVLLAGMQGLFGPPASRDVLVIARSLGSDVPFFLAGTAALVEGTGERVVPAGALPPWYAVIVVPPVAVSTARAYAALDDHERPLRPRADSLSLRALAALQRGDFEAVVRLLSNDFHDVVTAAHPVIARAAAAFADAGVRCSLSGSGSALFALARDRTEADRIAERLPLDADHRVEIAPFVSSAEWAEWTR